MGELIRFPVERARGVGPASQRLLTLQELREVLGGSERWWGYRIREGLPRHTFGKRMMRYSVAEVQAWLEDHSDGGAA